MAIDRLRDIVTAARIQTFDDRTSVGAARYKYNWYMLQTRHLLDFPTRHEAVDTVHDDVEQDQIWLICLDTLDRAFAGVSLIDDKSTALKHTAQQLTNDLVVVHDKDTRSFGINFFGLIHSGDR